MTNKTVKTAISFATEDFITPGHDAVLMRICDVLEARGIAGSFHLTGEFARYLRRERRTELIARLKKHEIGYHSNTHGCFPFIGDTCESNSWDDAVAHLMAQEVKGILDITEIFGRRPVYYIIEFLKAPQVITAIKNLGIDLFGIAFQPGKQSFADYCGALHLTAPLFGIESPPEVNRSQCLKQRFDEFYDSLGEDDKVCKIFNHPYKFLYNNQIESWTSVNPFYTGYDIYHDFEAPQKSVYSEETIDQLFADFEEIIDHILAKGVIFKTTSELAEPYRVKNSDYIGIERLVEISVEFEKRFNWIENNGEHFSPAEIFGMLVYALNRYFMDGNLPEKVPVRKLLGPTAIMTPGEAMKVSLSNLRDILKRCEIEIDFRGAIPHQFELCDRSFTPGDFRLTLLTLFLKASKGIAIGGVVAIHPGPINPDVSSKPPFSEATWTKRSYPKGFSGKNICTMAANQGWTFKPVKTKQE